MSSTPDPLQVPANKDILQNCKTGTNVAGLEGSLSDYLMEAKFDGFRLSMRHNLDGTVDVYTRNGKLQNGKLPWQEAEFAKIFPAGTVVDGEICAPTLTDNGKFDQNFEYVQHVMLSLPEKARMKQLADRRLTFYVFDCLVLEGQDIRNQALTSRRQELEDCFLTAQQAGIEEDVKLSMAWQCTQEAHDGIVRKGFEGTVVKQISSPYSSGKRGKGWFKLKPQTTFDAVIIGFKPGSNKNKDKIGGVIIGQHSPPWGAIKKEGTDMVTLKIEDKVYISRGSFGAISDKFRDELTADPDSFIGKVVECKHMGAMPNGRKLRHPEFERLRPDKFAVECVWDDGTE